MQHRCFILQAVNIV